MPVLVEVPRVPFTRVLNPFTRGVPLSSSARACDVRAVTCVSGAAGCSGRDKMMSPGGAALEGCPLQCSALQNAQEGRILLELFPKAAVRVGRAAELVAGSARHAMHARARGGWCWVC